jgi:hypothetical protein
MEPNPGEKKAVVEWQEISNEEVAIHNHRTRRNERAASQEHMETKPNPGNMQSMEEHQEIPKEESTVMPVGGLRKRRRDRNLAGGRRQKPKGRIQASCESRNRLTVADKKITRRATVAWDKRILEKNCDPRKLWTTEYIDCRWDNDDLPCRSSMA